MKTFIEIMTTEDGRVFYRGLVCDVTGIVLAEDWTRDLEEARDEAEFALSVIRG